MLNKNGSIISFLSTCLCHSTAELAVLFIFLLLSFAPASLQAQGLAPSAPTKEYIYFNGRLVAIELHEAHIGANGGTLSPAVAFGHEFFHAFGPMIPLTSTGDGYDNEEERQVITGPERRLAEATGNCSRTDHHDHGSVYFWNPIEH